MNDFFRDKVKVFGDKKMAKTILKLLEKEYESSSEKMNLFEVIDILQYLFNELRNSSGSYHAYEVSKLYVKYYELKEKKEETKNDGEIGVLWGIRFL